MNVPGANITGNVDDDGPPSFLTQAACEIIEAGKIAAELGLDEEAHAEGLKGKLLRIIREAMKISNDDDDVELLLVEQERDAYKEFDIATKVSQAINEVAEATPDVPEGLDHDSHQIGYSTAVLALVSKLKFAKGK